MESHKVLKFIKEVLLLIPSTIFITVISFILCVIAVFIYMYDITIHGIKCLRFPYLVHNPEQEHVKIDNTYTYDVYHHKVKIWMTDELPGEGHYIRFKTKQERTWFLLKNKKLDKNA